MENQIRTDLKNILTNFRYNHTIMVAEEAQRIAKYYNMDEKKAYLAGLVHDIAKDFNDQENKHWIQKYKINKNWLTPELKPILHAEIGYYVVKECYHLDEDICNTVRFHTIGNINMTALAKIIFIADKIARENRPKELEEVASLVYQDIDKALLLCLQQQKKHLNQQGKKLHPDTELLLSKLEQEK